MTKAKGTKAKSVPSKHIHSRLSYLHQAASYLSLAHQAQVTGVKNTDNKDDDKKAEKASSLLLPFLDYAQSRQLLSQLRAVSLKSQTRLTPQVKHSLCKRCNSLLIPGKKSTARLVNGSKGEKKPCADVLVVACSFCGTVKRFPIGQPRHLKKAPLKKATTPHSNDERVKEVPK